VTFRPVTAPPCFKEKLARALEGLLRGFWISKVVCGTGPADTYNNVSRKRKKKCMKAIMADRL